MPLYARFIMAGLNLLVVWKIVRTIRIGTVTSRGMTVDINQQPMLFALR